MAETEDFFSDEEFPFLHEFKLKYQHRHEFRTTQPQPPPPTADHFEPVVSHHHQPSMIKSTTSSIQKSNRRYQNLPPPPPPPSNNNGIGGPGMQALFLDSPQKSSGTGVFLPRISSSVTNSNNNNNKNNNSYSSIKPACTPVLLPSRVVKILNLNVHQIGFQTKPFCRTTGEEDKSKHAQSVKQYKNMESSTSNYVNRRIINKKKRGDSLKDQNYASTEIFLPKEWTY